MFNGNGLARELSRRIDGVEDTVQRMEDKFDRFTERVDDRFNQLMQQVSQITAAHQQQQRKFQWRANVLPSIIIGSGALIMTVLAFVVAHA